MLFDQLYRRDFITLLGGAAAAWPLGARAASEMPVVGRLLGGCRCLTVAPIPQGLEQGGLSGNRDVTIDYRFGERDVSRLPALPAELVDRKVMVVYTANRH
jgi:putative ABC transport system substrate-binding protein